MEHNLLFTETTKKIEGFSVTISIPTNTVSGVTFILPGANVAIQEYNSHRDVLISKNQIVLSFFINVLWPMQNNHRMKAEAVKRIFDTFYEKYCPYQIPKKYSIVGHSAGGKIALLVSTLYDQDRILNIIALDPVDQVPPEFTNVKNGTKNLSLQELSFPIVLTLTDGGGDISKDHDAHAIHQNNPKTTILVRHEGAGHMAYTDHGGGCVGKLMPKGTPAGDRAAWEGAHELICEYIGEIAEEAVAVCDYAKEIKIGVTSSHKGKWKIVVGATVIVGQIFISVYLLWRWKITLHK